MKRENISILLIQPPSSCVEDDRLEPPLGLLYLGATLKEAGFCNISFQDMSGNITEQDAEAQIDKIGRADVYAVSCFSTNFQYVTKIVRTIKRRYPGAMVVTGGPHPTALPELTLEQTGCDAVVVGEGEDALKNLIEQYCKGSKTQKIVSGYARDNIDSYAFPDRSLADMKTYSRRLMGQPVVSMLSSRGCKHRCIHCNSVVMGGGSLKTRYRSPENILCEMKLLRPAYKYFRFNDDHFTGHPRLDVLLEGMYHLDVKFRLFARVEDLDSKTCKLLSKAGCIHLSVGLESLNPDNLRSIGKYSQNDKVSNLRIARDYGITVRASFMVGLPYDSDESVEHYFNKAARAGIDEYAIYPLIPYPGTLVAKYPEKLGYEIINHDFNNYVQIGRNGRTVFALKHKNFSPEDVRRWLKKAEQIMSAAGIRHMRKSEMAQ